MEDTKSLLIMVLQKIFHSRPKVVEDTYRLIYNYNNSKRAKSEYERTLKNVCDLMNDELPSEVLVYLLTLVDMPNEDGNQLPIMEKIQKTYCCLAESVRPCLLEYLSNKKAEDVDTVKNKFYISKRGVKNEVSENVVKEMLEYTDESSTSRECKQFVTTSVDNIFLKPATKRSRSRKKIGDYQQSAKSLLDITADYVAKNETHLKNIYKMKLTQAWKIINMNCYSRDILTQCYNTLEYVNRKIKLLRCIENNNVSDVLMEEYENSDILLKEDNMFHSKSNPFQLSEQIVKKLNSLIND